MLIEEIKHISSSKDDLKKFGLTIGIFLMIVGSIIYLYDSSLYIYFVSFGFFFIAFGLAVPKLLLPLQKAWMTLAVILGFFMTRVILSILFYLVVTPIGLITKLLGKDFLQLKIDKTAGTYWNYREKKEYQKIDTERQF